MPHSPKAPAVALAPDVARRLVDRLCDTITAATADVDQIRALVAAHDPSDVAGLDWRLVALRQRLTQAQAHVITTPGALAVALARRSPPPPASDLAQLTAGSEAGSDALS